MCVYVCVLVAERCQHWRAKEKDVVGYQMRGRGGDEESEDFHTWWGKMGRK